MSIPNIETMDRRFKWWLLITSVVTLALLLAAALKENVFSEWRMLRWKYAALLQEKATDARGRAIADQFEMRIVQQYIPALQAVDRCMTCHPGIDDPRMANESQPFRTHPGDYVVQHPPEQFGCTICHRGQGRALVFAEATAEGYHWDYPLLPKNLTQSACGLCHTAEEVAQKGGEKYAEGKALFETKGCYSCHKLGGHGGSMGPVLDTEGLKAQGLLPKANLEGPHTLPQWLIEHFRDPQKIVADSQMKPPQLSDEEIEALTVYMLSLQNRDLSRTYLSPEKHLEAYKNAHPDPLTGEQLYQRYCATCHDTGEYTRYDKFYNQFFPAIRGTTYIQVVSPAFIEENIRRGHPDTLMPAWGKESGGLSAEEIARVREFLLSRPVPASDRLPAQSLQVAHDPAFKMEGQALRGSKLFMKHCAGCHLNGLAPNLFNPVFQETATDGMIFLTIALGRKNTPMPTFLSQQKTGLTGEDVMDLVAFIRSQVGQPIIKTQPGAGITMNPRSSGEERRP